MRPFHERYPNLPLQVSVVAFFIALAYFLVTGKP